MEHLFVAFLISSLIFSQHKDSHASSLVYFYAHVFALQLLLFLDFNCAGIIIHLPFKANASIIASSSLRVQVTHTSCFISSLLDDQPSVTYVLSSFICMSFTVAIHISCLSMHVGMFVGT